MRSITHKLILAFISISMLSTLLVVVFTRWRNREEFRTFLIDQNRPGLVLAFASYYHQHGSWEGIGGAHFMPSQMQTMMSDSSTPGAFTLIDPDTGRVLLAGEGYQLGASVPASHMPNGIPIQANNKTVGVLLINRPMYRITAPGAAFLERINLQTFVGGLVAVGLALLLAVVLSSTLTRPIRELTLATHGLASGNPPQEVPVRSQDELGQLATSFNRMSNELSRSLELRRQMTADIAHELRTPLSVILGHAEAVHDGVLPASVETFEIVREEAERLEHLVDDLRTLSMADAGELKLVTQPYGVRELLSSAAKAYAHQARQKKITLAIQVQENLPPLQIDAKRMREVISNILDNALRYTPERGRVTISARMVDAEIEIRVQDSGPGVDAEELDKIFERFYRTEVSRSREDGGSGLGFAIAKSIVERHMGRIWAESKPGRGLSVIIRFPISSVPGPNPV